jgi:hypothetical protein
MYKEPFCIKKRANSSLNKGGIKTANAAYQ